MRERERERDEINLTKNKTLVVPQIFLCDFEKAMANGISGAFPFATILGCTFHFFQAVHRWVSKKPEFKG